MKYSAAFLALAASASAHMRLEFPTPFPTGPGGEDNGPVENDGSNFPCRVASSSAYTATAPTEVKAGETMKVTFKGSAVHGGGSCQFSLSTDTAPTKESQWKVIHSIIGGCLTSEGGNMGDDRNALVATPANVPIPKDLPDGQYTFGWSWLNKVGNREFYHNCAPITVTGGGSKDVTAVLGGLPDMFVANLPREECENPASQDFDFPNPGESVVYGTNINLKVGNVLTGSGCAQQAKIGAGNGSLGSPKEPTQGKPTPSAAPTPTAAPSAAPIPSNPGGVFAPGASSAAAYPTTLVAVPKPTGSAPQPPVNNNPPSPPATPPTSGGSKACTNEGGVVCFGTSQFGLCDHGYAVPMQVAAGMTCSNGAVTRRSIHRAVRGHFNRRHGSNLV